MIDDYLRQLRRRGIVDPDIPAEVRAHPRLPLAASLLLGLALGWMDSRPGFDATGVTVAALLAGGIAISAWSPRHAWRWALALGGFVPLFELSRGGSAASLAAVGFAGAGALVGATLGRAARSA